jgi:protein-L-isoaspartate(D-aspartate) O-methyltransferase
VNTAAVRRFYADEIDAVANLRTRALVEALATVPREHFLKPGPWSIPFADPEHFGAMLYRETPDADPRHVYHNVLVALDPKRELNNGHPSSLCSWIDALQLNGGGRVYHLGCGSGYYTALMATVVGQAGHVVASEIDAQLAEMAHRALAPFAVELHVGDGIAFDPGPVDAILVNAGVTHVTPLWLRRLEPDGRMLVPITYSPPGSRTSTGLMILVVRHGDEFQARAIGPVAIFASEAGRSETLNDQLRASMAQGTWRNLRRVRRDQHDVEATCWLHVDGACLSTRE